MKSTKTKTKTTQPRTLDEAEAALGDLAYEGYLDGRLAGVVPADSPARAALVTRYAAPRRERVAVYTFLFGLREAGCPLLAPDELLTAACAALGIHGDEVLQ